MAETERWAEKAARDARRGLKLRGSADCGERGLISQPIGCWGLFAPLSVQQRIDGGGHRGLIEPTAQEAVDAGGRCGG